MPKMIVSIDGVVIKEVTLAKDRTTLGRRPYNDIVIDNLAISGEHAVLHMAGSDVQVEDLNSTNGTYVNARAVKKQALEHNDIIEVGKYKIRFLAGIEAPEQASDTQTPGIQRATTPVISAPIPLSTAPTVVGTLNSGVHPAAIRVLSGIGAGRELSLEKVVTTIGKPGVAVAAVTRRLHGYVIAPIDGGTTLNGEKLGSEAVTLQDGDVLELGGTKMQFIHA